MEEAAAAVPVIAADARAFADSVNGPLWAVAAHVPIVGSAVSSAQDLAAASVSAADAAQDVAPVLPLLQADRLRGPDGRIDFVAAREGGSAEATRKVQDALRRIAQLEHRLHCAGVLAGSDQGLVGTLTEHEL